MSYFVFGQFFSTTTASETNQWATLESSSQVRWNSFSAPQVAESKEEELGQASKMVSKDRVPSGT